MSRKVPLSKGFSEVKKQDLLGSSGWKPVVQFTSPARRPATRNLLTTKLDEFCKSNGKMFSPDRTQHTSKLIDSACKECLVLVRMQSNLSQELAEKETRLSKCLRLIDDLIQDSDSLKAKMKVMEIQNNRLSERLRTSEKSRSDSQLRDLANSRTQHIKKFSELGSTSEQKQQEGKLTELIKENSKLRNRIDELQLDKRILTNLKDEAVKSQEFMQTLYNSFKAKFVQKKEKPPVEQGLSKSMDKEIKHLRSKCHQLENSVRESMKRHQVQSQSPPARMEARDDQEKEEMRKKFTELKNLYQASEKSRQDIMLQYTEEISKIKQASIHQGSNTHAHFQQLVGQMQKWKKLCQDREAGIEQLHAKLKTKEQQLEQLKQSLEEAQLENNRTGSLEQQLISLTSELSIVRNQNTRLRDQIGSVQEQARSAIDDHFKQRQELQAEMTKLNFDMSQLQYRNRQLATSENAAKQQLQLSEYKITQLQQILQEKGEREARREQELQSVVSISGRQFQQNMSEISKLRGDLAELQSSVDNLERELQRERQKYVKAAEEWDRTFRKMEVDIRDSGNRIGDLQAFIQTLNTQNQQLKLLLSEQKEKLIRKSEQRASDQNLIEQLIQKQLRISQLEEGLKGSAKSAATTEDLQASLARLQAENDSLIQEVYEKDLALSDLQKQVSHNSAIKPIMETMETVQSDQQDS